MCFLRGNAKLFLPAWAWTWTWAGERIFISYIPYLSFHRFPLSLSLSNQNISWPFSYFLNLSLYEKSSISCIAGAIWTRDWLHKLSHPFSLLTWKAYLVTIIIIIMVVKIPIWILRSYNFTISSTQNDPDLSKNFAIVQDQ